MISMIDGQMPPPPIDAWGAFFEHFDKEIAAGRETQESVRAIHEHAHNLDLEARLREVEEPAAIEPVKMSPCLFEDRIDLTAMDVARIAVERWNDRNAKARECYDAGEAEGLNMFPRSAA